MEAHDRILLVLMEELDEFEKWTLVLMAYWFMAQHVISWWLPTRRVFKGARHFFNYPPRIIGDRRRVQVIPHVGRRANDLRPATLFKSLVTVPTHSQ